MTDSDSRQVSFLFDAELHYQDGMAPVTDVEHGGELVGNGTGTVAGPHLRGIMRWSNFERSRPDHCQLTVAGEIETDDGAVIRFDSRGFALPQKAAGAWRVASAVRFIVDDPRYRWLEPIPAIWEGEFDAATAMARYRAYAPSGEGGW